MGWTGDVWRAGETREVGDERFFFYLFLFNSLKLIMFVNFEMGKTNNK